MSELEDRYHTTDAEIKSEEQRLRQLWLEMEEQERNRERTFRAMLDSAAERGAILAKRMKDAAMKVVTGG